MKVPILPTLCLSLCFACVRPAQTDATSPAPPRGDFLGQTRPAESPELFAPGLVSTNLGQRDTAIAPGGDLLLYTIWGQGRGTLVEMRRNGDDWSGPEVAAFSGAYSDIEPHFSPDGRRLYFASQRPLPGESDSGDWNLWQIDLEPGRGRVPRPVQGVNGDGGEYYPSVTREGVLYFTAQLEDSVGGEDIYRALPANDGFEPPRSLGPAVNSPGPDFNAFIAPDESYVIFGSVREGDEGGGDLYISFRDPDGDWTASRSLGPAINSPSLDYCPFVTADGRWLFTSQRTDAGKDGIRRGWPELVHDLNGPLNGEGSLYWVDAGVIDRLRDG